jgi:hypothetical protein
MASRLFGHKLTDMVNFRLQTGTKRDSYAENLPAISAWTEHLAEVSDFSTSNQVPSSRHMLAIVSFTRQVLLEPDRLMRPSATQILDRLQDIDIIYHPAPRLGADACRCRQTSYIPEHPDDRNHDRNSSSNVHCLWPMLDLHCLQKNLAYLLLDTDMDILAHSDDLSYLSTESSSIVFGLNALIPSIREIDDLRARSSIMLSSTAASEDFRDHSEVLHPQDLIKSLYVCRLRDTQSRLFNFDLRCKDRSISPCHTLQLTLARTCLGPEQRRERPFFILAFAPEVSPHYHLQQPLKLETLSPPPFAEFASATARGLLRSAMNDKDLRPLSRCMLYYLCC